MKKHTPGPWIYGQNSFQKERDTAWEIGRSLQCEAAGGGISGLSRIEGDCDYFLAAGEMSEANARLIASAPELLEALQQLIMCAEYADETGYVADVGFVDIDSIHDKARAAIAKAIGE